MRSYWAAFLILILSAGPSAASLVYKVQGDIADAAGNPLTGTYLLEFKLRQGGKDGAEVWSETQYIRAEKGGYRASLGGIRAIPEDSLDAAYLSVAAPAASGWHVGELVLLSISAPKPPPPRRPVVIKKAPPKKPVPVSKPAAPAAVKKPAPIKPVPAAKTKVRVKRSKPRMKPAPAVKKPAAVPAERPSSYQVQAGDTLPSIAKKLYGTSKRWKDLYRANRSKLGRGGSVRPGQTLDVP